MSDGTGYLLPSVIEPDESHFVCVEVPDDIHHRIAFLGAISSLAKWYNWERDEQKQGTQVADVWKQIYLDVAFQLDQRLPTCQQPPDEGCNEFPPNAEFINYYPQHPFDEPSLIPSGYIFPPFLLFNISLPEWLPDIIANTLVDSVEWLTGYEQGDVIIPATSFPFVADWSTGTTLPTIEIKVIGAGVVELHMLSVPVGGGAMVTVDVQPDPLDILDGIFNADVRLLELERDFSQVPPETEAENITEVEIDEDGEHTIYITFLPVIDDAAIPVRFGGGLRKVVLCGVEPLQEVGEEDMTGCCTPQELARLLFLQAQGLIAGDLGTLSLDDEGNPILTDDTTGGGGSGSAGVNITSDEVALGGAYGVPQGMQRFINEVEVFYNQGYTEIETAGFFETLYLLEPGLDTVDWTLRTYAHFAGGGNSPNLDDDKIAGYTYCYSPIKNAVARYNLFDLTHPDSAYLIDRIIEGMSEGQFEVWRKQGEIQPQSNFSITPCYRQPSVDIAVDDLTTAFSDGSFLPFPTLRLVRVTASGSIQDNVSDRWLDALYKADANGDVSSNGLSSSTDFGIVGGWRLMPTERPVYQSNHTYVWTLTVLQGASGDILFRPQNASSGITEPTGAINITVEDLGEWAE